MKNYLMGTMFGALFVALCSSAGLNFFLISIVGEHVVLGTAPKETPEPQVDFEAPQAQVATNVAEIDMVQLNQQPIMAVGYNNEQGISGALYQSGQPIAPSAYGGQFQSVPQTYGVQFQSVPQIYAPPAPTLPQACASPVQTQCQMVGTVAPLGIAESNFTVFLAQPQGGISPAQITLSNEMLQHAFTNNSVQTCPTPVCQPVRGSTVSVSTNPCPSGVCQSGACPAAACAQAVTAFGLGGVTCPTTACQATTAAKFLELIHAPCPSKKPEEEMAAKLEKYEKRLAELEKKLAEKQQPVVPGIGN